MMVITLVAIAAAAGFALLAWRLVLQDRRRSEARIAALAAALDGPASSAGAAAIAAPFSGGDRTSAIQGRPLLKVAIGFVTAVVVIVGIALIGDRQAPAPAPSAAADGRLELLSMRHAQSGNTLTVTGLVRNAGDEAAGRLIAVVLAFDRSGEFIGSGRAPLEFPTLGRFEESPFQVTVANVPEVARYRVSFRTEAGVVSHVDRRDSVNAAARP